MTKLLLSYEGTGIKSYHKQVDPLHEMAILDLLTDEVSLRQAASVLDVSQQGVYMMAVRVMRKWANENNGKIDLERKRKSLRTNSSV